MEMNDMLEGLMGRASQFAHLMRRMMHFYHKGSEGPMMHPGQGGLLMLILKKEPVAQKELVEILDIRPSSLSELLKKLEAKGLIARTPDEQDKRNVVVALTPQGRKLAEQTADSREDLQARLFAALSEDELKQFDALLAKLAGSWQKTLEEAGEDELPCPPHRGHGPHAGMAPDFRGRQREWQRCDFQQRMERAKGWNW